jgi:FkbH-like protein
MMNWLPVPADFRASLKEALAADDPLERYERLVSLSQYQLGFLETIQLDNAIKQSDLQPESGFRHVRLAILSSCTIDHLLPAIRIAALRRGLHIEVYAGGYGQYRQEILDSTSPLYAFDPDLILFSLTFRDTVASLPIAASSDVVEQAISNAVDELVSLWRRAKACSTAAVIQQTFLDATQPMFGSHDRLIPGAPTRIISRLNDRVAEAVSEESILLLDIERASARDGLDTWFDVTRWLQGKIEIAPQAASRYGDLVARVIGAQYGHSRKCLVLDLDNTVWGGVIGDDGIEGIVLGEGSAAGEAHLALQRYAKSLKERGVILAVCSKNEIAVAEAPFRDHPEMHLERSDFAAFVANWVDKAENLRTIAKQLNIGLDSLVFVDDNPVERARIRAALPMVAVPELPADVADYVRCIADAGYFEAINFTIEDQQRASQYTANIERDSLRDEAQSMDEFLRGLEMSVEFGPISSIHLPRVTQLVNKTNQFNTTTRRYTGEELSTFATDTRNITLQFRLADRFGDNGLVSVMILCPDPGEPDVFEVVNWVMSCRVFGRQLEDEAMNIAVETALARGARALRADFIPTEKNGVIKGLYDRLGFSRLPDPTGDTTGSRWNLRLADYTVRPTFLTREASQI